MKNRQIIFAYRPEGEPGADVFAERVTELLPVGDGNILCRNLAASIDPYLRLKMYDRRSYTPPLEIGQLIPGRTIAVVVESRSSKFQPGDHVAVGGGWQEYAAVDADAARKVDLTAAPAGAWLGALGMTGLTAYAGLTQIGKPKFGETLVVSGAGGAVGSMVGQIGKIMGCRVVGVAGTADKCRAARDEFGFDDCVNYRDADFISRLAAALPAGCDIYFDNVGGRISRAVAQHLNDFARIPLCGLISQYDGQNPAEPTAFDEFTRLILTRRLTVRGFIVSDIATGSPEFEEVMTAWLKDGRIRQREYRLNGFDRLVPAFLGLLRGENTGKTVVQISES
jgi:NADPH-dependent curcumin reductase CurA